MLIGFYSGYMGGFTNDDYQDESPTLAWLRGSEIAIIWISRELVKLGHDVHIFSPDSSHVCEDKVTYHKQELLQGWLNENNHEHTRLIVWRYVNFFIDYMVPNEFKGKIVLWLHDYTLQPAWQGKRLTNDGSTLISNVKQHIWKTVCVSEHQAARVRKFLNPVNVIGNGLIPEMFQRTINKKIAGRCVWTSAWNRGLKVLLDIWPEIQKKYTEATLHVYGCNDDTKEEAIELQLLNMTKTYQITVFGKSNNATVIKALEEADMFIYPSIFVETYCTSALEAQMAGCICVVSDIGALPETIGDRGLIVKFDNRFYKRFVMAVTENIGLPPWSYDLRLKAMTWASQQSWAKRAKSWEQLLNR
jgi:glycosyltransferase involved in cell wall biosynthesis